MMHRSEGNIFVSWKSNYFPKASLAEVSIYFSREDTDQTKASIYPLADIELLVDIK